jgi:hypothetical protein
MTVISGGFLTKNAVYTPYLYGPGQPDVFGYYCIALLVNECTNIGICFTCGTKALVWGPCTFL